MVLLVPSPNLTASDAVVVPMPCFYLYGSKNIFSVINCGC